MPSPTPTATSPTQPTTAPTAVPSAAPTQSQATATTPGALPADQIGARPTEPAALGILPSAFGAVGDGVTDDTAAVQRALDSLAPGQVLTLPRGKVYLHSDVLVIRRSGVTINGTGTLLASNEARSAVWIDADNVTVDGPTIRAAATTKRWTAWEQMGLRLLPRTGIVLRNVTVDASAAAGIYVGGATNFALEGITVTNTRADGIHMTRGSNGGLVSRALVNNSGDDGIAVVSYAGQAISHDIVIKNSRVTNQHWGRGFSVVGGQNVTYMSVSAYRTAGAAMYFASEAQYDTQLADSITVDGAVLEASNQQAQPTAADRPSPDEAQVVQGAVLVYSSQANSTVTNVTMRNVTILDTVAAGHVRLVARTGAPTPSRLAFDGFTLGGTVAPLGSANVPGSAYRTTGWTNNSLAIADHLGW